MAPSPPPPPVITPADVAPNGAPAMAWPGSAFPMGATPDGGGTNFAVWSSSATRVWVCLFDAAGAETRVELTERIYGIWHGYVPGVGPGQRYGLRTDGLRQPDAGRFHDPAKLLIDPYAKAITGAPVDDASLYPGSTVDSGPYAPRSVVVSDVYDWSADQAPATSWSDTVVYEMHVRGFTRAMPDVPAELRGTYAGLGHPAAVQRLRDLGVTAVELMPIHYFGTEPALQRRGLVNYWGYNTLGFFAPHEEYAHASIGTGSEVLDEFRDMVKALHAAGIEVILDVVYNHTGEGPVNGPVLSLRGLDNRGYYRHVWENTGQYADYTGCGNTVDTRSPQALTLVMDSLRFWVQDMHVDGFRFDLASALSRDRYNFDDHSAFLSAVAQDPVLKRVKLIAEPWDVGAGGYQVGGFPQLWSEWNGRYRDSVRDFWAHGAGGVRDLAYRLAGSSDLYRDDGREPWASVNFVTAHDGFTLRDLTSYAVKHNEANGEHNSDGSDDNRSYNCGTEGDTIDPAIQALRLRQARNLLTTLLLSTGVPMLTAGDERWRTQGGNNNAYCHDNPTSWLDWTPSPEADDLTELTKRLLALRRSSPVLRRQDFFDGAVIPGTDGAKDAAWFGTDGTELDNHHWFDPSVRTIGMLLDGRGLMHRGAHNEPVTDSSYLLVLHAGDDQVDFTLPVAPGAAGYLITIDTSRPGGEPLPTPTLAPGANLHLIARSAYLLTVQRA
jgi:isoamylase